MSTCPHYNPSNFRAAFYAFLRRLVPAWASHVSKHPSHLMGWKVKRSGCSCNRGSPKLRQESSLRPVWLHSLTGRSLPGRPYPSLSWSLPLGSLLVSVGLQLEGLSGAHLSAWLLQSETRFISRL